VPKPRNFARFPSQSCLPTRDLCAKEAGEAVTGITGVFGSHLGGGAAQCNVASSCLERQRPQNALRAAGARCPSPQEYVGKIAWLRADAHRVGPLCFLNTTQSPRSAPSIALHKFRFVSNVRLPSGPGSELTIRVGCDAFCVAINGHGLPQ
jgi:hypothetical protein